MSAEKGLDFYKQIDKMDKNDRLLSVVKAFSELDLNPRTIDNVKMGYIFEDLIRRFSENAEAGDHYTGRDIIKLMVNILLAEGCDDIFDDGKVITVLDPLGDRMKTILFHRNLDAYKNLVGCLESISKDQDFINKMNGISMVSVPKYQAKTLPEFDVFISHANKDKEDLIEELYQSLNKLGIKIFYDKESLEWGDNWKDRILNGTKKAEFAIIVISENFFDREWTERELNEFLNRQNRNGQKLILPILHNITVSQLQEKYPSIADIQAIDSSKYSCDQIALLFARQLIKRLKSE